MNGNGKDKTPKQQTQPTGKDYDLWKTLRKANADFPDFPVFQQDMQDEGKRSDLWKSLRKANADFPDFETFTADMGVGKKKDDTGWDPRGLAGAYQPGLSGFYGKEKEPDVAVAEAEPKPGEGVSEKEWLSESPAKPTTLNVIETGDNIRQIQLNVPEEVVQNLKNNLDGPLTHKRIDQMYTEMFGRNPRLLNLTTEKKVEDILSMIDYQTSRIKEEPPKAILPAPGTPPEDEQILKQIEAVSTRNPEVPPDLLSIEGFKSKQRKAAILSQELKQGLTDEEKQAAREKKKEEGGTLWERVKSAAGTMDQAYIRLGTGILKANGIVAEWMVGDQTKDYKERMGDNLSYQIGSMAERWAEEMFPADPRFQEEFLTTTIPSVLPIMTTFMAFGIATNASRFATLAEQGSVGAEVMTHLPAAVTIGLGHASDQFDVALEKADDAHNITEDEYIKKYYTGKPEDLPKIKDEYAYLRSKPVEETAWNTFISGFNSGTLPWALPVGATISNVLVTVNNATGGLLPHFVLNSTQAGVTGLIQMGATEYLGNKTAQEHYDFTVDTMERVEEAGASGASINIFLEAMTGALLRRKAAFITPKEKQKIQETLDYLEGKKVQYASLEPGEVLMIPRDPKTGKITGEPMNWGDAMRKKLDAEGREVIKEGEVYEKKKVVPAPKEAGLHPREQRKKTVYGIEGREVREIPTEEVDFQSADVKKSTEDSQGRVDIFKKIIETGEDQQGFKAEDVLAPIKVEWDAEQGKYVAKDGNHRLLAYQQLGIKNIPVDVVKDTPKEKTPEKPKEEKPKEEKPKEEVEERPEPFTMTPKKFEGELQGGRESVATIPGEPIEWIGDKIENSPAALIDTEGGKFSIRRNDGSFLLNPESKDQFFETREEAWKEYHKDEVRRAVEEGKEVPEEVMNEYPDLKPGKEEPSGAKPAMNQEQLKGFYEKKGFEFGEDGVVAVRKPKPKKGRPKEVKPGTDEYYDQWESRYKEAVKVSGEKKKDFIQEFNNRIKDARKFGTPIMDHVKKWIEEVESEHGLKPGKPSPKGNKGVEAFNAMSASMSTTLVQSTNVKEVGERAVKFESGDTEMILDFDSKTGEIVLESIRTKPESRGQGGADKMMDLLTKAADKFNLPIRLRSVPEEQVKPKKVEKPEAPKEKPKETAKEEPQGRTVFTPIKPSDKGNPLSFDPKYKDEAHTKHSASFIGRDGKKYYIQKKVNDEIIHVYDVNKDGSKKMVGVMAFDDTYVWHEHPEKGKFITGHKNNNSIEVDPAYRRKGIGTALIDFVEDFYGLPYIETSTARPEFKALMEARRARTGEKPKEERKGEKGKARGEYDKRLSNIDKHIQSVQKELNKLVPEKGKIPQDIEDLRVLFANLELSLMNVSFTMGIKERDGVPYLEKDLAWIENYEREYLNKTIPELLRKPGSSKDEMIAEIKLVAGEKGVEDIGLKNEIKDRYKKEELEDLSIEELADLMKFLNEVESPYFKPGPKPRIIKTSDGKTLRKVAVGIHTKGVWTDGKKYYKALEKRDDRKDAMGPGKTNEYEVLKKLQDIPEVIKIGEVIDTEIGRMVEIEKLYPVKKITLEQFLKLQEVMDMMLNERNVVYDDHALIMQTKDGQLKIADFSTAWITKNPQIESNRFTYRVEELMSKKDQERLKEMRRKEREEEQKEWERRAEEEKKKEEGEQGSMSSASRFRPSEKIVFTKPLVGPSGAKLVSYEWKWKPEEYVDNRGEDKVRRISDWNQAETSGDTGRDIVHQFTVEYPDGSSKMMSSESVLTELGFTERTVSKNLPSLMNAVKTLARQKMELQLKEDYNRSYEEAKKKVEGQERPEMEVVHKKDGLVELHMGDVYILHNRVDEYGKPVTKNEYVVPQDRIVDLNETWVDKRLKEEGFDRKPFVLSDLKDRIDRTERKINDIQKKEKGATKAKPKGKKPAAKKPEPPTKQAGGIVLFPVKDIDIDTKRFQGRNKPFVEDHVQNIVENFDARRMTPITIWRDPKNGNYYVLAGHNRLEAHKRMNMSEIEAKIFEGTEKEAIEAARKSNAEARQETPIERARYYREQRESGKSMREIEKEAKGLEGRNANKIINLSFLNPNGKLVSALQQMEGAEVQSASKLESIADWIGDLRRSLPTLSNIHENEIFDWLMGKDVYGKRFTNKVKFKDHITGVVAKLKHQNKFDSDVKLNLKEADIRSSIEIEYDHKVQEVTKALNEAKRTLEAKRKELLGRVAKGEGTKADAERALREYEDKVNKLTTDLANLETKRGEVAWASQLQQDLFVAIDKAEKEGKVSDKVDEFEIGPKAEEKVEKPKERLEFERNDEKIKKELDDIDDMLKDLRGSLNDVTTVIGKTAVIVSKLIKAGYYKIEDVAKYLVEKGYNELLPYLKDAYRKVKQEYEMDVETKTSISDEKDIDRFDPEQFTDKRGVQGGPVLSDSDGRTIPVKRPPIRVASSENIPTNVKEYVVDGKYEIDGVQRFGVNLALNRFLGGEEGRGFLLADGAGVGKTREILVTAHEYKQATGKDVLIITLKGSMEDSFPKDAKTLGINLKEFEIGTYDNLRTGKVGLGEYGLVIFDESHNLKNPLSQKAVKAKLVEAENRMFCSATPMDKPEHAVYFFSEVFDLTPKEVETRLGIRINYREFKGEQIPYARLLVGEEQYVVNLINMRDEAIQNGAMIRREYPFFGEIREKDHPMPEALAQDVKDIEKVHDWRVDNAENIINYKRQLDGLDPLSGDPLKEAVEEFVERERKNKLNNIHKATEPHKADIIYPEAKEALEQGYQVAIVGSYVNATNIRIGSDMSKQPYRKEGITPMIQILKDRFEQDGYEVATLYGGNKEGVYEKERDAFQSGEKPVLLMTSKSGGTGINLDDVSGGKPRVVFIATPDYSGDQLQQVFGRFSRRNTQSPTEVNLIYFRDNKSDYSRKDKVTQKVNVLNGITGGKVDLDTDRLLDQLMGNQERVPERKMPRIEEVGNSIRVYDAYEIKEQLKALPVWSKWNRADKSWIFLKKDRKMVEEVISRYDQLIKEKESVAGDPKERPGDFLRRYKSNQDKLYGGFTGLGVAVKDGALETVALAIDLGYGLGIAIERGLNYIRKTEWYDKHTKAKQKDLEKEFTDMVQSMYAKEKFFEDPAPAPVNKFTIPIFSAFVKEDVIPFAEKSWDVMTSVKTGIVQWFYPKTGVSSEALDAIHKRLGIMNEEQFRLEYMLNSARKLFEKMKVSDRIAFIDRMKRGEEQPSKELQWIADLLRELDEGLYIELENFNPGLPWKENHFRVIWKVIPGSEGKRGPTGRGPGLEGTKGMMKRSTLLDMSEGIALGGEPVSTNPIELFILSYVDAKKFITAQRMMNSLKELDMMKFVRKGSEPPFGFRPLKAENAKRYYPVETKDGGKVMLESGEYYFENNVARILDNHLMNDPLRDRSTWIGKAGRTALKVKNGYTAVELGLSLFHFTFETMETISSAYGLSFRKFLNIGIYQKDPKALMDALNEFAKAPVTWITVAGEGHKAIKLMGEKDFMAIPGVQDLIKKYPDAERLLHDLFVGGGKLEMYQDYKLNSIKTFKEALAKFDKNKPLEFNYIGAGLRALPTPIELFMKPLFEFYIPRLKIGLFLKEYSTALVEQQGRLRDGFITREELARKTWEFVEDRLGEMNFDNLFWNKAFKTTMQILFRSVTWKLGNLRGMGTAPFEQWKEFQAAAREGRPPMLEPKMAWLMGLALTQTVMASIIQYVATGEPIDSFDDWIAPMVNPDDPDERVIVPTYAKDAYHIVHDPGQFVMSSTTGLIGKAYDITQNKDYYGYEIFDPTAPLLPRTKQKMMYALPMPFSFQTYKRMKQEGEPFQKRILGFVGFVKAPRYITNTHIENEIFDMYSIVNSGVRPFSDRQAYKAAMDIASEYEKGNIDKASELFLEYKKKGIIKMKDEGKVVRKLEEGKSDDAFKYMWNALPTDFKKRLWEDMTPEERNHFDPNGTFKERIYEEMIYPVNPEITLDAVLAQHKAEELKGLYRDINRKVDNQEYLKEVDAARKFFAKKTSDERAELFYNLWSSPGLDLEGKIRLLEVFDQDSLLDKQFRATMQQLDTDDEIPPYVK